MPIEPNPFDRPGLLDVTKDGDPLVVYIIVRKSLNMDIGKVAAQVGHGIGMLMGGYSRLGLDLVLSRSQPSDFVVVRYNNVGRWLESSYRKVVLGANDKDWEKIKAEVDVFLVQDAGLTEVASGSETVLVTWPMRKSAAPKVIQRLQALKSAAGTAG